MAYIPDEVFDRVTEISTRAFQLYCYLARCRNHKSGQCNPSVEHLSQHLDLHPRNVLRMRAELKAKNWARFDGDFAILLVGFPDDKNASGEFATGKNATLDDKNATPRWQFRQQQMTKTPPNDDKNASAYKEEPAKEPANRTSKGEPTRASAQDPSPESSGLEPLIAILADHYKLHVEPNRRHYEQAARAVLARHQGEAAAERLSAFLRAKPGQKLTFFATDFAAWDAGTAKLRAAAGIGSYSQDFDIAPGTEILDGMSEDELAVLKAKVLCDPNRVRFDQWEPDKAEAYLRIEMAAIAKQEAVNA